MDRHCSRLTLGPLVFAVLQALILFGISLTSCGGIHEAAPDSASSSGNVPAVDGSEATRDGGTSALVNGAPDKAAPTTTPTGPPAVQSLGRFDTRDSAGPKCAWPGCRVIARFEGTSVSAKLNELDESWMQGAPSEWDVAIDGVWQPKLVTTPGTKEYTLKAGLPAGVHVVELYKRSEAQNGVTQFLGYDFGGGTLLAPPAREQRRIEIIGDSQPAAFGVEAGDQGPDCPGVNSAAKWENFRKSFGALLGESLDAEVNGTVYSGKGMAKNIWRADKETMPVIFPRALPNDPSSTWDFTSFIPDVVVIMIGGNDFAIGKPVDDGPATLAQFTDAYEAFAATVREKYPAAHIFLVTSPSVSNAEPAGRDARSNVMAAIKEVLSRRKEAGDAKVYSVVPPVARKSELTGCNAHGNPKFHERLANDLLPLIEEKTGWR